mmetsp:Transcript_24930/g.71934  ORF Transcript_24930/g.71934 Transcript_24930/m.71934 type:complete len:159 (-) Transcript_24930:566-1042(-)
MEAGLNSRVWSHPVSLSHTCIRPSSSQGDRVVKSVRVKNELRKGGRDGGRKGEGVIVVRTNSHTHTHTHIYTHGEMQCTHSLTHSLTVVYRTQMSAASCPALPSPHQPGSKPIHGSTPIDGRSFFSLIWPVPLYTQGAIAIRGHHTIAREREREREGG